MARKQLCERKPSYARENILRCMQENGLMASVMVVESIPAMMEAAMLENLNGA